MHYSGLGMGGEGSQRFTQMVYGEKVTLRQARKDWSSFTNFQAFILLSSLAMRSSLWYWQNLERTAIREFFLMKSSCLLIYSSRIPSSSGYSTFQLSLYLHFKNSPSVSSNDFILIYRFELVVQDYFKALFTELSYSVRLVIVNFCLLMIFVPSYTCY